MSTILVVLPDRDAIPWSTEQSSSVLVITICPFPTTPRLQASHYGQQQSRKLTGYLANMYIGLAATPRVYRISLLSIMRGPESAALSAKSSIIGNATGDTATATGYSNALFVNFEIAFALTGCVFERMAQDINENTTSSNFIYTSNLLVA
jgi:hypothetical protein